MIEPLTLTVVGKPPSLKERLSDIGFDWRALATLLLLLGVLILLLRRWLPAAHRYLHDRVTDWRQGEAYAFRKLRQPVRQRDTRAVYHGLLAWLHRLDPGMEARSFARDYGDAALSTALNGLSHNLYGGAAAGALDFDDLYRCLAAARRRFRKQQFGAGQATLPSLNP